MKRSRKVRNVSDVAPRPGPDNDWLCVMTHNERESRVYARGVRDRRDGGSLTVRASNVGVVDIKSLV